MDYRNIQFISDALGIRSELAIQQHVNALAQSSIMPQMNMTPYIIEERQMNMTQIDVFSRLMKDRIVWVAGQVNEQMATIVQAQLMFMDSQDSSEQITLHIDTPGGCVKSGLSIVDVMDYVKAPVATINTGMCASMGSILLGAGEKGLRSSLRFSRTMIHQSSGSAGGNIEDARITMVEWEKLNKQLFELIAEYSGKTYNEVVNDAQRDNWMSADEAVEYGIIDNVIGKKPNS